MNEPIAMETAILACEKLIEICNAATPGRWHFMNHRMAPFKCDCHCIMGEGNGGSLFNVSSNMGIEYLRDGSNDSPSPAEAIANANFVVIAKATLRPIAQLVINSLESDLNRDYINYGDSMYDVIETIITNLNYMDKNWETK